MKKPSFPIKSVVSLTVLTAVCIFIVAGTHQLTKARIALEKEKVQLKLLHQVVPVESIDNNLIQSFFYIEPQPTLGTKEPHKVYVGTHNGIREIYAFTVKAQDGYNGVIELIIGIRSNGTISGVRTVSHHETPGLGDFIETSKSKWITHFDGKSLSNPEADKWAVKRDDGVFDQSIGATITPRAVVKAIKAALVYFENHRSSWQETPYAE